MSANQSARPAMLMLLSLLLIYSGVGNIGCLTFPENGTDILALWGFKRAVTPRQALSSWNTSIPHCKWEGVSCSLKHPGRVTALELGELGLSGTISPSLGNLTSLEILNLSMNGFTGELPPFSRLHNLKILDLSRNFLTGEIPPNFLLPNLLVLQLSQNNLTGRIPASLKNSSSLQELDLADNLLTGSIPDEAGEMPNLLALVLYGNRLSGGIPETLCNHSSLKVLSLYFNMLDKALPYNFGDNLPSLRILILAFNKFQGHIPASLGNISELETLELSSNHFIGQIPSTLGRLGMLNFLNLQANNLEAKDIQSWEFIGTLSNCTSLQVFGLAGNQLQGAIPNSIGELSPQLQQLGLDANKLSGPVPINIGNLSALTILDLSNNKLDGPIDGWVGKLNYITVLDLDANSFTGPIPSSIGNLTKLAEVHLAKNEFEGRMPPSMGNLTMLTELNLSYNNLQGNIPREIFHTSSSLTECVLSYNNLQGTIPTEVSNLKQLVALHLSSNKLSGEVPGALGECQELQIIQMDQNILTGDIPPSLSNLKSLVVLNFSQNSLSGIIPTSLSDLKFLIQLDLSYNQIHGEIPTDGVFENVTAVSLNGNWGLCGGVVDLGMRKCPAISSREGRQYYLIRALIPLFGFISLVLLIYFVLLKRKMPRRTYLLSLSFGRHFPRVSYKDLAQATHNFSESNLIGKGSYGSVYIGKLAQAKMLAAIKVFDLDMRCGDKSFISECEVLRSIQHRNLIPILTACSTIDHAGNAFKAIIYEFMPNGNLDTWLHKKSAGENPTTILSLLQRISIAINIADVLAYIHHDVTRSIVHCDLKPSNILLDVGMNAYLGDFGIANLVRDSKSTSVGQSSLGSSSDSSIGLTGTIGYMAPEYARDSQPSTCGDVYSFGIVILEILTGHRPTDSIFGNELNIVNFAERNFPDQIIHIIDGHLLEECEGSISAATETGNVVYQCLLSLVQVALSCTCMFPRERANMREVAIKLHAAKASYVKATEREQAMPR